MPITRKLPFTPHQQALYEKVCARLDADRLKQLLFDLTDIHSPTGATRAASEFIAGKLAAAGLTSAYKPMSQTTGNVLAERRGSGGGAALLLYAPIDTHLEGDHSDYPWVGPDRTADLMPRAKMVGDWVYGLGSSNPKAMVSTIVEIATALAESGVALMGDLNVGFADGGMPVNIPERDNAGRSNGVFHLLNRGMAPDFAIIMKPWNWVYHVGAGKGDRHSRRRRPKSSSMCALIRAPAPVTSRRSSPPSLPVCAPAIPRLIWIGRCMDQRLAAPLIRKTGSSSRPSAAGNISRRAIIPNPICWVDRRMARRCGGWVCPPRGSAGRGRQPDRPSLWPKGSAAWAQPMCRT